MEAGVGEPVGDPAGKAMPIPIVILAGSDGRPAALPAAGRALHALSGYKGVDLRLEGRPIIVHVVERLLATGCFCPVYVAGPLRLYGDVGLNAEVIDVDEGVAANVRAAVDVVSTRHPGVPLAFTVCDVLPDGPTLAKVMDLFERFSPCDIFYPVVKVPADDAVLGASAWKPRYVLAERRGEPPCPVLPGHLLIGDPAALRLEFLYRLLELAYRTRNRPVAYRRNVMFRGLVRELLWADVKNLFSLHPPTVTASVIATGLHVGIGLLEGWLSREEVEGRARKIFVTSAHRRRHPGRRVVLPFIEGLTLAMDIDTVEEARQVGAEILAASELPDRIQPEDKTE